MNTEPHIYKNPAALADKGEVDVSIIVVTYNSEDVIASCLETAIGQDVRKEIILVDNSPGDETYNLAVQAVGERARLLAVRSGANIGFAAACNLAMQHATGRYALFLNPDVTAPSDLAAQLASFLNQEAKAAVVGPALMNPDGTVDYSSGEHWGAAYLIRRHLLPARVSYAISQKRCTRLHVDSRPKEVEWVLGACFLVEVGVWQRLGGMDERFFLAADDMVDFSRRASNAGFSTHYLPAVKAVHGKEKSYKSARAFAQINVYNGHLVFAGKHLGAVQKLIIHLFFALFSLAKSGAVLAIAAFDSRFLPLFRTHLACLRWLVQSRARLNASTVRALTGDLR